MSSEFINSVRDNFKSGFNDIKGVFTGKKTIQAVSKENMITGIALAILGIALTATGSPFFGVLLILSSLAITFIGPDVSKVPSKISDAWNSFRVEFN